MTLKVFRSATREIRTPEGKTHRISSPARWPGYAIVASADATCAFALRQTEASSQK